MQISKIKRWSDCYRTFTFEHETTKIECDYGLLKEADEKELFEIVDSILSELQTQFGEEKVRKEIFDRMGWEERNTEDM